MPRTTFLSLFVYFVIGIGMSALADEETSSAADGGAVSVREQRAKDAVPAAWYPLPPVGASATFSIAYEMSDFRSENPEIEAYLKEMPKKAESTFIVKCVGQADLNGDACRWIEIKAVMKPMRFQDEGRILILKLLVPERGFREGAYPLSHVKKAYFLDSDWTDAIDVTTAKRIDEDPARLQYELDRFLPQLPIPPRDAERTADQAIETGLGSLNATRVDFDASYDGKLHGGTAGRWTWQGRFQAWLSPESPFGIVALRSDVESTEIGSEGTGYSLKAQQRMVLQAVSDDAVSDLPQCR